MTSGKGDGPFLAGVAVALMAFALVNTFSVLHDVNERGGALPFWEPFVWEVTSILVIFAMLPVFMAFARRFWPVGQPWWRTALAHGVGVVVFSAVHILAMGVLRWAVYAAVGSDYAPLGPLGDFFYEFRKDALGYAGFLALYVAWRQFQVRPAVAPPAEPGTLEVRDGARRHFIPLAEVAWIEAAGNYVELHRGQTPILHRASLSDLERQLDGAGFVRIHRSRLVRREAIAEVESKPSGDYVVRLSDGRELAGSRRYRRPLLEP